MYQPNGIRRVLITAASKHGSTEEIALRIADRLEEEGLTVTVSPPPDVQRLEEFDVVVLGSAVYAGHWMDEAKELAERVGKTSPRPVVWLFSSGPIGSPPKPEGDPIEVPGLIEATEARDHRVFAGKLDRARLGLPERVVVAALKAPEGDFRDWDAIDIWAKEIASSI